MEKKAVRQLNADITTCTRCRLSLTRTNAVPGEGPVPSELFFIGEAPGRNEDLSGRPFVGRAGTVLEDLLASISLRRDRVFITSIVKCRPPENRVPRKDEVAACEGYLQKQMDLIAPTLLVPMGRLASELVFSHFGMPNIPIGQIHGQLVHAGPSYRDLSIVPVYHPAALTHNPPLKGILFEDFRFLGRVIEDKSLKFGHDKRSEIT